MTKREDQGRTTRRRFMAQAGAAVASASFLPGAKPAAGKERAVKRVTTRPPQCRVSLQ